VVREDEVVAAAVHVEVEAEKPLGHGRALDVPAGTPVSPGRRPVGVLALLGRLPEREVERIVLAVGALDPLALIHLVDVAARQLPVARQGPDAEVDVAVRRVGVAALHERLDQLHDLLDRLRRERLVIRPAEAEPLRVVDVVRRHLGRQLGGRAPGRPGGVVDLVVDVGDVGHQRGVEPLVLEEPLELGEDHEGPGVADVYARIDRGSAGVDPDLPRLARGERLDAARPRVVEPDRAHWRA
jgi:hypothetical protein